MSDPPQILPYMDFMRTRRRELLAAPAGATALVRVRDVLDVVPHFWRKEAETIPDWVVMKFARIGVAAVYDPVNYRYELKVADATTNPGPADARAAPQGARSQSSDG